MRWRQGAGLFALCLWSSAGWLIGEAFLSSATPVAGQGLRLLLAGLVGVIVAFAQRPRAGFPASGRCVLVGLASIGLVGLPYLLLDAAAGRIASSDVALVFALLPILVGLIGVASSAEIVSFRGLPYGLLGVAGVLILLPVRVPESSEGAVGLGLILLAMIATGSCMVWLHGLLDGFPLGVALALTGAVNGMLLGLVTWISGGNQWNLQALEVESLRCLVIDLPEMALLVWLVKAISPLGLSARYVVAPLLTVLEGIFVLRPHLDVRTLIGLGALGVGAFQLIRGADEGDDVGLRLV